jgi:hypothetical protein
VGLYYVNIVTFFNRVLFKQTMRVYQSSSVVIYSLSATQCLLMCILRLSFVSDAVYLYRCIIISPWRY